MPDLQSEMDKVLRSWESPEAPTKAHHFQPTTNTSRATFEFVRDNPGIRRVTAMNRLIELGHKKASVSSLLVQFIRQGQMRETNGVLFVTQPEYTPLKASATMRNAKKALAKKADYAARTAKRKETLAKKRALLTELEDQALLGPVGHPAVVPPPPFSASVWVDSLTIKQAKAVYEELKEIFG